ncbi:MAG TPA: hypothetical protein VGB77_08235 [Abditibacteriaceae bacterium]
MMINKQKSDETWREVQADLGQRLDSIFQQLGGYSDNFADLRQNLHLMNNGMDVVMREARAAAEGAAQTYAQNQVIAAQLKALSEQLSQWQVWREAQDKRHEETAHQCKEIERKLVEVNQRGDVARRILQEISQNLQSRQWAQPPGLSAPVAEREEWSGQVKTALREFHEKGGPVGLFAHRLAAHLNDLTHLADEIATQDRAFWSGGNALDDLERRLFLPELGLRWDEVAANVDSAARSRLRSLETAVLQWRLAVREEVARRHGIAPLEVVPRETRFDATLHESNDFFTRSTDDKAKHDLIVAVEKPGYLQKQIGGFAPRILRRALVTRFVWQPGAESPREQSETIPQKHEDIETVQTIEAVETPPEIETKPFITSSRDEILDESPPVPSLSIETKEAIESETVNDRAQEQTDKAENEPVAIIAADKTNDKANEDDGVSDF